MTDNMKIKDVSRCLIFFECHLEDVSKADAFYVFFRATAFH